MVFSEQERTIRIRQSEYRVTRIDSNIHCIRSTSSDMLLELKEAHLTTQPKQKESLPRDEVKNRPRYNRQLPNDGISCWFVAAVVVHNQQSRHCIRYLKSGRCVGLY